MEFDIQNDRKKTSNLSDIGSKLRSGRESAEQDLTYCADHLNIPIEYLDAIEKENYYVLPGWPYTIKCIKLYANYLDINAELLINDLYRKYELEKILHANKKHYKHINIFWHVFRFCFFSFLLMVIISILINDDDINYYFNKSKNDIISYINNLHNTQKFYIFDQGQEEIKNKNNPIIDVVVKDPDKEVSYLKNLINKERDLVNKNLIQDSLSEISMIAGNNVWVEIKNNKGNVIISRIFEKGDKYRFPSDSNYSLSTNDPSRLEFYNSQKSFGLLGDSEEILSDINISEYLINLK